MDNDIKLVGGVWLPATETHMNNWMVTRNQVVDGKLTYQYHKLQAAMAYVKDFGVAIDVGAHCGLWSMHLAKLFKSLYAFEPIPLHRKCWAMNATTPQSKDVAHTCKAILYPLALGDKTQLVKFYSTPGSTGDTFVDAGGNVEVEMVRLDEMFTNGEWHPDTKIDFIKLDCEGYELFALRGGEEMLKRCKPCVVVEQKPNKAPKYGLGTTDAVKYLQGLGAVARKEIGGDYIMSWG